jgi:diguanylate cyclase (GGDEF)-like protein
MSTTELLSASPAPVHDLQKSLKQLDRRDWWLWVTAAVILLLLCFAVFSLSVPAMGQREEMFFREQLDIGVRGLFALVLLFTLFALYQQYLIKQLRNKLQGQIVVVSDLHGRAETFEKLSILDPLTGLFNRRFAVEYLPREIARCERNNMPLVAALIDLDDFKQTNDTYGHAAGDAVLEGFAQHIRKAIRSADLPVRMGGDEFLIVLPECGDDEVDQPLKRLSGCVVDYSGVMLSVKFSVGWVQCRPGETAAEMLQRGDVALYQQKFAKGRRSPKQDEPLDEEKFADQTETT